MKGGWRGRKQVHMQRLYRSSLVLECIAKYSFEHPTQSTLQDYN